MATIKKQLTLTFKQPNIAESYGPYASVLAAHEALSEDQLNVIGMTVGVEDSTTHTIEEYWYQGGTSQVNLVKKQSPKVEANPEDPEGEHPSAIELLTLKIDELVYMIPESAEPDAQLSGTSTNSVLNKVVKAALDGKAPSSNILKNALANDVQTSLNKADTALQPTGVKTINNLSIVGSGNITIEGGGTDDYADLNNKPQINSVVLSGNKSVSDLGLATAAQGTKADNSIQMPNGGSVGQVLKKTQNGVEWDDESVGTQVVANPINQATESLDTVQIGNIVYSNPKGDNGITPTIDTTTKHWIIGEDDTGVIAEGQDGADAVNPFKGWWPDLATLKAAVTAVPGDYAYIIPAVNTDPVAIYEYDSTATTDNYWTDSGRTFNPANNQEFASGQALNTVNIVDNPHTDSPNDVPSARQVKLLNDLVEVGTEIAVAGVETQMIIYNNQLGSPIWINTAGYSVMIPVNPGEQYSIYKESGSVNYAVMTNNEYGAYGDAVTNFATGYTNKVVSSGMKYITIPPDGHYLYVRVSSSTGISMKPVIKLITQYNIGKIYNKVNEIVRRKLVSSDFSLSSFVSGNALRCIVSLPFDSDLCLEIEEKEVSDYQYRCAVNKTVSDSAGTGQGSTEYRNGSLVVNYLKDDYDANVFLMLFKNGSDGSDAVNIDDVLSAYDIFVTKSISKTYEIKDDEKKFDLYNLSDNADKTAVSSDYCTVPIQNMTMKIILPVWLRVRFLCGVRTSPQWTSYYYNGNFLTFTSDQCAVRAEFSRVDGRGLSSPCVASLISSGLIQLVIQDSNDGSVISRNYDCEKYLGAIMATPDWTLENQLKYPVLVHISDFHGDAVRLKSACKYADYINANILINTGDNPFFELSNGVGFHEEIIKSHKTDYANCLGNHDQYGSNITEIHNLSIAPFAATYGYHKSNGTDVTDTNYFYKDLGNIKVRLISLDIYEGLVYKSYQARVSQTQITWFINTLASTPANYGVIVIMHQPPHDLLPITGKTNFISSNMPIGQGAIDSDYMSNGKIVGNPFGKIIDHFISHTSGSGSYTQKNNSNVSETVNWSCDFTSLNIGVEFIAYLNGHCHRDYIGIVNDCQNRQLNLNITTTSGLRSYFQTGMSTSSDCIRGTKGANQDAFNVYTIDRANHMIGVARIGSNITRDLVDRKVMFVNYKVE